MPTQRSGATVTRLLASKLHNRGLLVIAMSNAIPMPHAEHEIAYALDIARHMAMSGIPIFTAAPCLGRGCTPDCLAMTKGEGQKSGYHLPSKWDRTQPDPRVVESWVPGMALCAIGGYSCDFLDIDPRNGGVESAEALWRDGAYPCTYGQQLTPSGGRHELIAPLRTGKGTPAPGIDIQGGRMDGTGRGFVFLAPTVRASKVDGVARPYRWTVAPDLGQLVRCQGEASGAKLAAMVPQHRGKTKLADDASAFFDDDVPHTTHAADAAIAKHCDAVHDHARRGWDGFRSTLNRAAFAIGAYVGSSYLPYETAVHLLTSAIQRAGQAPDGDDQRWIEQGIEDGAGRPIRVVYPRSHPLAHLNISGEGFGARLITVDDLDDVPDPEPLIDGWLYKDTTARLIGQPGSYKSFVALDMACCVASGRPWHGNPVQRTAVLYVVGEGLSGYKRRIAAWCEHNGVDRAELREGLRLTRGAVQIGSPEWAELAAWAIESKAGFVVVDTQAKATVEFDENSNPEQTRVIACLEDMRQQTGGTLLLLHHTGHANGEASNRGRGASAWRGGVDTELILTKTGERTGALLNDRQKEAASGNQVAVTMVLIADSLAVTIEDRAPLGARSQWLVEQCRKGVRYGSANEIVKACRDAGHSVSNVGSVKAALMDEWHRLVAEQTSRSFDPNKPAGGVFI